MKLLAAILIFSISTAQLCAQQHPITFFTKTDALLIKADLNKYPVLSKSFAETKADVDLWLDKDVDVPFPKDPAGGYTHERHKSNYMLMFNSGILYNITGNIKYATLVKKMFLKYASLNPTLKNHPEATSSSPGRIFWQALNDANWLVYTGMAYDLIYNSLTPTERKKIEDGAFKPEVDYFTKDLKNWFNLMHNHAVWACAGVGIVGIATNNKDYVGMALYGSEKDGKAGFIAQMNELFAPDGYYTEGPYYVRYAILPYYLFANALHHSKPELKVFQLRNQILKKALEAGLQQTNTDGRFFPLNDAIKDKDFTSNELVSAINIAWEVYGADNGLLTVAKKQGKVLLNRGGASIAKSLSTVKNIPSLYSYRPAEFTDGKNGDEGGVSLLRSGSGNDLTTLIYKYTSFGLSHGHFDKLNINLFDKGNEVLQDYGSVRFVGVEQKYGGRYLKENKSYATQSIAHNTMVVDESSHFNGSEDEAEKYHSQKLFSSLSPEVQVVSAMETNAYKNILLQRTVYLLQLPGGKKIILDIFNANSEGTHQYDLPFQFAGQVISTSFKYKPSTTSLQPLGKKNGYQFLWKEAEANNPGALAQFTFLNNKTYYSISSVADESTKIFFTRAGANDPDFNLRREPSYIIRKDGSDKLFLNVIEIHGNYDPIAEFSSNSYPSVKAIQVLANDADNTVAEIMIGEKKLVIAQANRDFNNGTNHSALTAGQTFQWTGPFFIRYDNMILK